MAAQLAPSTSGPELCTRRHFAADSPPPPPVPAPPPAMPATPSLRNVYDRISEMLLDNYALTGNADWIGMRDRATAIFAAAATVTATKKPLHTLPPLTFPPTPTARVSSPSWEIDSTKILDVSMMLDGNYNATADPEWLEIGSRMRSCYRDDCRALSE